MDLPMTRWTAEDEFVHPSGNPVFRTRPSSVRNAVRSLDCLSSPIWLNLKNYAIPKTWRSGDVARIGDVAGIGDSA